MFIHNDPYFGGSHLPDVNVVAPIYLDDKVLLGYTCVRAHWPDIGGASPGSYGATSEIYGEGLRLPGVRLYTQGRLNTGTSTPSSSPMCAPLRSAVATSVPSLPPTCVAQCECKEIAQKYGVDVVLGMMTGVQDYSERMIRAQLERLGQRRVLLRGFLRRRWHPVLWPDRGRAHLGQAAGEEARRLHDHRLRWQRRSGRGPHERPPSRHRLRCLHRRQDDHRPQRHHSRQLRHLARHRCAGPRRQRGERAAPRPRRLRQPRDDPPHRRHGVRRSGPKATPSAP